MKIQKKKKLKLKLTTITDGKEYYEMVLSVMERRQLIEMSPNIMFD